MTLVDQSRWLSPHLDTSPSSRPQQEPPSSQQQAQPQLEQNVGSTERIVSGLSGALLAFFGLGRRSIPGLLTAGVGAALIYRAASGHCPLYGSLGISSDEVEGVEEPPPVEHGVHVVQSYLIDKSPQELYDFWRNFENLPSFMKHLESVKVLDGGKSHWVAKAPKIAGGTVQWDAEIVTDEPGRVLAWRSLPGADVDNAGEIKFEPTTDRGTRVTVTLEYDPPAGAVGKWVAKLFGEEPQQQVRDDLRNFKRLMEAGEIPTTKGQPRGTCTGTGKVQDVNL